MSTKLHLLALAGALAALGQSAAPLSSGLAIGQRISGESSSRPIRQRAVATDVEVVMRLVDPPLAAVAGGKRTGWRMTPA